MQACKATGSQRRFAGGKEGRDEQLAQLGKSRSGVLKAQDWVLVRYWDRTQDSWGSGSHVGYTPNRGWEDSAPLE